MKSLISHYKKITINFQIGIDPRLEFTVKSHVYLFMTHLAHHKTPFASHHNGGFTEGVIKDLQKVSSPVPLRVS